MSNQMVHKAAVLTDECVGSSLPNDAGNMAAQTNQPV